MNAGGLDRPRVVIDTNAVLGWLVFREPAALALGQAVEQRRWVWCTTPAMLDELRFVLSRPLSARWEQAQEHALTIDLESLADLNEAPTAPGPREALVCRDPADQMFIDLALRHPPCWLVTSDRALLTLRRRAAARGVVIAPAAAWHRDHVVVRTGAEEERAARGPP